MVDAGFKPKEISVFMIYNYEEKGGLDYKEMEAKIDKIKERENND